MKLKKMPQGVNQERFLRFDLEDMVKFKGRVLMQARFFCTCYSDALQLL